MTERRDWSSTAARERWRWPFEIVNLASGGETRRADLLRLLAVIGVVVALALVILAEIGRHLGFFESLRQVRLTTLFPVAFILLSVVVLLQRHRSGPLTSKLYVWMTCVIVVSGAVLFNGYRSATWLLVIWPVVLAGSLLRPMSSLGVAIGAFLVYLVVMALQQSGLYSPPMPTAPAGFPFFALSFGWVMIIMVVALVGHLASTSLRHVLEALHRTSSDLEMARLNLSQRVDERTAELKSTAEQLRAIAELGQITASIRHLSTLLPRAAVLISERLDFYHVGIFMLDSSREWAVLRAASSAGGARMLARGHRLRVGQQGIVGHVAEMGVARFAANVGEDAVWFSNPDLPDTQSEIALPLIAEERLIGVLDIQVKEAPSFVEEDVRVLQVLADSIATAIYNAQLLQETQEALARLDRYQRDDAVQAWRRALERRKLQIGYEYIGGTVEVSPTRAAQLREHIGQVSGVTRQMTEDGRYLLLAPIHASGTRLGMLSFEASSAWTDEAVQLVETVVGQLDLTLTNARLLEETRLRAAQEAARGEIVGRIRALNSTDAILRNAAEELGRALQVERSRIQLVPFGDE